MPKAKPLLLDIYPMASVAYSLRKLRTAYTGSAIRVRRSSDNTEQDFGFDNSGDLDVNSIENFVGWNLFAYSEQLQQSYWTKTNLTVTTDIVVAPDGLTTGDVLFETTTNAPHTFQRNISLTSGQQYTISFWVKDEGRNFLRVVTSSDFTNTPAITPLAWLNLSTGTIVSQNSGFNGSNLTITSDGSWYKVSYTLTAQATGGLSVIILNTSPNGSTTSYVGDVTKGIAVWGLQVTQSSTVKPYRQTLAIAEGQGFVTTWYDQSGNANNLTQATAANQAQIVLNGSLRLDPDNNKVSTQWTTDSYTLTSNITIAQNFLMFSVVNRAATNGVIQPLGSISGSPYIFRWLANGDIISQVISGGVTHATADTTIGDYVISALRDSSNVVKAWKNTNALSTGTSTGLTALITRFGTAAATNSTGWFQELIYWNTDLESSRSAIETAINTYYSVY